MINRPLLQHFGIGLIISKTDRLLLINRGSMTHSGSRGTVQISTPDQRSTAILSTDIVIVYQSVGAVQSEDHDNNASYWNQTLPSYGVSLYTRWRYTVGVVGEVGMKRISRPSKSKTSAYCINTKRVVSENWVRIECIMSVYWPGINCDLSSATLTI